MAAEGVALLYAAAYFLTVFELVFQCYLAFFVVSAAHTMAHTVFIFGGKIEPSFANKVLAVCAVHLSPGVLRFFFDSAKAVFHPVSAELIVCVSGEERNLTDFVEKNIKPALDNGPGGDEVVREG